MKIEVICPLYNAEKYLKSLHEALLKQKNVEFMVKYILTESKDKTQEICKKLNVNYEKIRREEFSHSLTREKAIMESDADIVVLLTQDVKILDELFLYMLTKDIILGKCEATYARQISKSNSIEKYIRESNYPNKSIIKDKNLIEDLKLNTFFFSDAAAAIKRDVFVKLNGYDNKDLIISEDMYYAYKLIMNGYRIKYEADAVVEHSHEFKNIEFFKRYFDTGVFFAENNKLNTFSSNRSGLLLLIYVIKRINQEKKYFLIIQLIINFVFRFLGFKLGKIYKKLPKNMVSKLTLNKLYWERR